VGTSNLSRQTSRRDFFRQAGFAALAIKTLSATDKPAVADDRKLGVALLGLGKYAKNQLGPALLETKRCYLAGVITGHPEKAEQWTARYNLKKRNLYTYDTMDKIVDNPEIDIVYVVTPPALHPEFTIRAAKAGKHVI